MEEEFICIDVSYGFDVNFLIEIVCDYMLYDRDVNEFIEYEVFDSYFYFDCICVCIWRRLFGSWQRMYLDILNQELVVFDWM